MPNPFVVVRHRCLNKPMALYDTDGNRQAPPGGILLFATKEVPPHRFPDAGAARQAIQRTVDWFNAYEADYLADTPDNYQLQPALDFDREEHLKEERRMRTLPAGRARSRR